MGRLLIMALFLPLVTAFMDMKFGYHVIEGNARYLENIETNLEKNTVKFHTPAHNHVMESYQIQDFNQDQQMKCLPSLKQCRLRDIDRETAVDAGQITEAFIHSWNKGDSTISSANEVVVREMYYTDFDDVIDLKSIGEALTEFYQDFKYPLYKEKKLPHDSEVLNVTQSTGRRVKRAGTSMNPLDCKGQQAKFVYGMDSGESCNHYKMCENKAKVNWIWVLTDCENVHITAPELFECLCCPWVTSINLERTDQCSCNRMKKI